MTAEVHQVEDGLLQTAAPEAGASFQEFRANATISANAVGHLLHIGTGRLTQGRIAKIINAFSKDQDLQISC
jgi:hypothetical protein